MIRLLCLSFLLAQTAFGSALRLAEVTMPLHLHGADTDPVITFHSVPFVTFYSDPEWRFSAISSRFVPPTDDSSRPAGDVNVASVCDVKVAGTYADDGKDFVVTIDASKARVPEGYPFTLEQVIDAITTCVKTMYPHRSVGDGELQIEIVPPAASPAADP